MHQRGCGCSYSGSFCFFLMDFFSCLIFHCGVVALMSQYREMMLLFIVSCSVHHHRVSGRRQVFALHNKQWEFVRLRDNSSLCIQDQSQLDITSNSMSFCMVVFNRKMRRCFLIILVFLQDMILCILQHVFCYSSYSCSYFFSWWIFFPVSFFCVALLLWCLNIERWCCSFLFLVPFFIIVLLLSYCYSYIFMYRVVWCFLLFSWYVIFFLCFFFFYIYIYIYIYIYQVAFAAYSYFYV